jgi:hypothetical protein
MMAETSESPTTITATTTTTTADEGINRDYQNKSDIGTGLIGRSSHNVTPPKSRGRNLQKPTTSSALTSLARRPASKLFDAVESRMGVAAGVQTFTTVDSSRSLFNLGAQRTTLYRHAC